MVIEVDKEGRATLPAELLRRLNVEPGGRLEVSDENGQISIRALSPLTYTEELRNGRPVLIYQRDGRPVDFEMDFRAALEEGRAERLERQPDDLTSES